MCDSTIHYTTSTSSFRYDHDTLNTEHQITTHPELLVQVVVPVIWRKVYVVSHHSSTVTGVQYITKRFCFGVATI